MNFLAPIAVNVFAPTTSKITFAMSSYLDSTIPPSSLAFAPDKLLCPFVTPGNNILKLTGGGSSNFTNFFFSPSFSSSFLPLGVPLGDFGGSSFFLAGDFTSSSFFLPGDFGVSLLSSDLSFLAASFFLFSASFSFSFSCLSLFLILSFNNS